ncbi:MAG: AAA family ATPase, partial [Proteocatella sp.]
IQQICKLVSAFGTGITDCKVIDVPVEKMLAVLPRQVKEKLLKEVENEVNEVENESFEQKNRKKKPLTKQTLRQINMVMRTPTDFFMLTIVKGEVKCKTIEFCHGNKNALFKIAEESDGTIRLLDLLEILFAGNGKTYIVDELDRCLHPSLTYKFIESFIDLAKNKNIQLIVTTHESRLLDFDLLRRDEIWFVNKRVTGESDIYSLEEYNERFDKKIDRAYLDGRYGGVPVFNTLFPIKGDVCK